MFPPTPAYFGLASSTVVYDPKAAKPQLFLDFLKQVLGDQTAIKLLQEWFGYTLVVDTRQHKILLGVGAKRSGKGTVGRIHTAMLGKQSVAGPTMNSLGEPFGLEPLIGKPLATISDARIGHRTDRSTIVERLLSISGEDTLTIGRKFKLAWHGRLPTRIAIFTNELISLADSSGALVSRFLLLLFPHSFYGKEDITLTDKLTTPEMLSGILNWAIAGYNRLRKRGHFVQPKNAEQSLEEMEMLSAPMKRFVKDCCNVGAGRRVKVDVLYALYVEWCKSIGREPTAKQWFGRDLRTAVPGLGESRPEIKGKREHWYEGIESNGWVAPV